MQTPGIYCVQGRPSSAGDHFIHVQGSLLSFMCCQCMETEIQLCCMCQVLNDSREHKAVLSAVQLRN